MGREVAVDCVVLNGDRVLLLKRAHEPFNGYWVLPGGHVERNETVEGAAVREMKEELGIDVEVEKLVGVFSDPDRDPRGLISVAFIVRPKSTDIRLNREASEYKWFPPDALPENIGFDHAKILAQARALLELQQP